MKNPEIVVSFGNYETKILVGLMDEKEIVLYTNSFSSHGLIINSFICKKDELVQKLKAVFQDIKLQLGYLPTKIIYNIPLDNLEIREKKSDLYRINNQVFNDEYWNKIFNEITIDNTYNKKYFCITKKVTKWTLDGVTYHAIPYGKTGELIFHTQLFLIPKKDIQCYLELFDELQFKDYQIVNDEIVMSSALERNKLIEQAIVNIGDKKTTISLYYNHSLVKILDYNFGIKNMTLKISQLTNVNEEEAILMLKNYNYYNQIMADPLFQKYQMDQKSLPFAIGKNERIMKFEIFDLNSMNIIIKEWIFELAKIINNFSLELQKSSLDIEELYIYTVTTIFEYWLNSLKPLITIKAPLKLIDTHPDSLHENKFIALIYCLKKQ